MAKKPAIEHKKLTFVHPKVVFVHPKLALVYTLVVCVPPLAGGVGNGCGVGGLGNYLWYIFNACDCNTTYCVLLPTFELYI
ncbi:MAG: hypothetical protein ACYDCN_08930 [Bacteroidia bacterium]